MKMILIANSAGSSLIGADNTRLSRDWTQRHCGFSTAWLWSWAKSKIGTGGRLQRFWTCGWSVGQVWCRRNYEYGGPLDLNLL